MVRFLGVASIVSVLAASVLLLSSEISEAPNAQSFGQRPNVVVIMTDDQDIGSLQAMDKTQRLLGSHGTTFVNAFATTPTCCPSRASYLTGQYAHNHGVLSNSGPKGGYERLDTSETLAVWLRRDGYRTAHIGKFLNGYGRKGTDRREFPAGWNRWYGSVGRSTYSMYGYTLNQNGRLVTYGNDPSDYQTDVYADKAVHFIRESADGERPFFLSVATLAPHSEPDRAAGLDNPRAAPRHQGAFDEAALPQRQSYDEEDVSDKPAVVRQLPQIDAAREDVIEQRYRSRLASLLAVDDLVERVVTSLEETGELDNTLVVFTSDNGYLQGEHRAERKLWPYQESAGVPLLMRGPGVPEGAQRMQLTGNIDLAPTVLDFTGANAEHPVDGRSLLRFLRDPASALDRDLLLEAFSRLRYKAVLTQRHVYIRHATGEEELYDLALDPFQLASRHTGGPHEQPESRQVQVRLRQRLKELVDCAGATCR